MFLYIMHSNIFLSLNIFFSCSSPYGVLMYVLIFIYSSHRLLPACLLRTASMPLPPPGGDVTGSVELEHPHQRHRDNRAILTASLPQSCGQRGHLPSSVLKRGPVRAEKASRGRGGGCCGRQISSLTSSSPSQFHEEEERLVTDLEESGGSGGIHGVWM